MILLEYIAIVIITLHTLLSFHISCHVFKAMRLSTGISCYGGTTKKYNVTVNGPPQEKCIRQRFNATQALARQTRFVFHMWDYNEEIAANATTFLVTLRNPVDRLISNYRYSHPANCVPTERKGLRPYGCHILNDPLYNNTQSNRYKTWRVCFPDPGIEEFAQSVMSPYPETLFQNNTLVQQQQLQWPCRKRARDMFLGKWAVNRGYPAPHMFYNYQHYSNKTVNKFPDKEVVAVRTSHEWEDMVALDKSLGGAGVFPHKGRHVSHGSETYAPSPVSSEAYQKMCCILHDEIREYLRLLTLAINFDDATKQETEEALRRKCAIDDIPWHDWHSECQKKIDDDDDILLRSTDYQ